MHETRPEDCNTRDVALAALAMVSELFRLLRDNQKITWEQAKYFTESISFEVSTDKARDLVASVW
jgi:hypothetical protein